MPGLLEEYSKQGLEVHHISMEDGCVPGFSVLLEAVFRVQEVNTICQTEKSLIS